ncbi:hypothetical protein [Photobacterium alginatilyticum]|uniref:Replication protein n=1 Tax=Photobacterium alginatilyticum TaxID=1775171 RepID=A0ABW9YIX2_9GAMM|nr:hypothetical protein [Photobacterium alginatilyticum]NBI53723.1 hypothetical protein [Photobacterium alginatilyticum]
MGGSKVLHAHSWREAIYYAEELEELLDIERGLIEESETIDDANHALNNEIGRIESGSKKQELINELITNFNNTHQLADEELSYLKNSYRACGFCIALLMCHANNRELFGNSNRENREKYNFTPLDHNTRNLPSSDSFLRTPFNIKVIMPRKKTKSLTGQKSRYRLIRKAFFESNIDLKGQEYLIDLINDLWHKCYSSSNHKKLVNWFDRKNKDQIESCIDYLNNNLRRFCLPWKPIDLDESYHALIAYFDYQLLMHPAETELTIRKMKAAWNQKKFREKTNGKRPYSVSMTDRTKERLSWLVQQEDSNISQVIKELIDKRYDQLKNL